MTAQLTFPLSSVLARLNPIQNPSHRHAQGVSREIAGPVKLTVMTNSSRHLTTVSLPDHVLPTGPNEVHSEVFSVPWRVCSQFVGLAKAQATGARENVCLSNVTRRGWKDFRFQ